ncbi:MAG: bifunctional diaminohydroxyphosphoribosylaminopyrimidine deaminase/5-amino-6-(5-phosphoribosylamino)uracil reductase RibD [Chloroflexi bacterium]|nr:MAG: bifunctional diaminohydroxyphosphoribosylaminopyrimidine deaminase/5-amino-6-(5-phosphoribosylamino)uracil reductase RibD [Chloroflexota bacterium]
MTAEIHRPGDRRDGERIADRHWSARALELALSADFRTSPNPMVGAVVLDREGQIAGEGYHKGPGQPHAEQEALAQAGESAKGGTLYINLEPCTHAHRTPNCADAVIESGIYRTVISMTDPDERVRGAGVKALESARVRVDVGMHEDRAMRLNEFYVKHRLTGRPFVTAKFAMSLDGKIATRTGESRWISGEESRLHAHRLRHQHDAVLVGINTVITDNPELTTRLDGEGVRQPLRIVVDSQLRIRQSARVVGPNTVIATTRGGRVGLAEVVKLPATGDGRVSLPDLMDELGRRNVISVLVEGGAEIHAAMLSEQLVDKVFAYVGPKLIGGREAPGPLGGKGVERLAEATGLHDLDVTRLGDDFLISGYVNVHRDR